MGSRWLRAGLLALTITLVPLSSAFAHAVCGSRIFPATLGIDDPGVGDELALPTLTWLPQNSDGSQEFDASFSYSKTIFPGFALSIADGPTWLKPGGNGWGNLDTEAKYNFMCAPDHEFMASVGLDVTWANSGAVVRDAKGAKVDTGRPHVVRGNRAELQIGLKPLPPGTYKVVWHVMSVDTHKTQGSFSFTVKGR